MVPMDNHLRGENCNILKEQKFYVHTKACMQMVLTALFIIVKNWKQPRNS